MQFSSVEKKDLLKSWVVLSIAFAILMSRPLNFASFLYNFLVSGLTVGISFLFHELGHKYLAQRYNCWAEYRSFDFMLIIALAMSFFGFIFAAPGAVMIHGQLTKSKYGKISAMGPLINIVLAGIFLALLYIGISNSIMFYGFYINSLLAVFNMIPFWNFDGLKIWKWSKPAYLSMLLVSIFFIVVSNAI